MNREIKFRALYDDMGGGWKYGMLIYEGDVPRIQHMGTMTFATCLKGTEGQFTGLKDKNETEIYEGDWVILNHWKSTDIFDYSNPFLVTYYEGEINFKQGEYNNFKGSLQGKLSIEVIGNQYEHPELTKIQTT